MLGYRPENPGGKRSRNTAGGVSNAASPEEGLASCSGPPALTGLVVMSLFASATPPCFQSLSHRFWHLEIINILSIISFQLDRQLAAAYADDVLLFREDAKQAILIVMQDIKRYSVV
ncbi:hypothetical protein NDU88_002631 [Pleurodeles waltl]|uniref:Reverse transcriptase domain-containing protein n=1 Tax=Pleurodeles waltl TaxID=8319 RepID=A0AAV7TLR1_PLEWA|nr:hypothetical protein NDU88_002631 [Pleurodeles waltl]